MTDIGQNVKRRTSTLSEWVKSVRSLIQIRIEQTQFVNEHSQTSIFKDSNIAIHLFHPNDKYLVVPADKAPNNIVFVRKSHYIDCLIKGLGIDNSLGSPTYSPTTIIGLFCVTLEFQSKMKKLDLPPLHWIP